MATLACVLSDNKQYYHDQGLLIMMEQTKHKKIAALIQAEVSTAKIMEVVGCSRATVFNVKKRMKDDGDLSQKPGSGKTRSVQTNEFLDALSKTITQDPTLPMRRLAKATGTYEGTIRLSVKDLGLKSYMLWYQQFPTARIKASRVEHNQWLLCWLRHHGSMVNIFSDKKLLTMNQIQNCQNDKYLAATSLDVPPIQCTKHPASILMLGITASDGNVMPPYWFPCRLKISTGVPGGPENGCEALIGCPLL